MQPGRFGSAVIDRRGDLGIVITRRFDAPAALVFAAWTTPELVRRWWGYESQPLVVCEIDLRVGGAWRYITRDDDSGAEMAWSGEFRTIVSAERLVSTEVFDSHHEGATLNTTTFAERGGVTTLTIDVQHRTQAYRDGQLASGMERGLQHGFDRFERLLTLEDRP